MTEGRVFNKFVQVYNGDPRREVVDIRKSLRGEFGKLSETCTKIRS